MAATATPAKPKRAAKKAAAPKKTQAKAPKTVGKGRTSKALEHRHDWTAAEKKNLVSRVSKAGYGQSIPIYKEIAAQMGNGIKWESVRAAYYQFRPAPAVKSKAGNPRKAQGKQGKAQGQPVAKAPVARQVRRPNAAKALDAVNARLAEYDASIAAAQATIAEAKAGKADLLARMEQAAALLV